MGQKLIRMQIKLRKLRKSVEKGSGRVQYQGIRKRRWSTKRRKLGVRKYSRYRG